MPRLLEDLKRDYGFEVGLVVPPYDPDAYYEHMKGYEGMKEGSERCLRCYEYRMAEAYRYADENHFDYFTTVMTISRQKSSAAINGIGAKLSKGHPSVPYLYSDFKKKGGIEKGRQMRIHYGLYNQQYCGCRASYGAHLKRESAGDMEAKQSQSSSPSGSQAKSDNQ